MEKARTTPEAYPLSLNGLVTGCNQKSNRHPLMTLTIEQTEDALIEMRKRQLVAEVHMGGRVAKFRHLGYDYMGVKGVEAGVMTELLLRGEQTAGELRTRAGRFEPIADLNAMQQILDQLISRGLVLALTPPGRGQLFSHNLYQANELESLKASLESRSADSHEADSPSHQSNLPTRSSDFQKLQDEVSDLRVAVEQLTARIENLER